MTIGDLTVPSSLPRKITPVDIIKIICNIIEYRTEMPPISNLVPPIKSFISTNPHESHYIYPMRIISHILLDMNYEDYCKEDFDQIHELLEILLRKFREYDDPAIKMLSFIANINLFFTSLDPAVISEPDKINISSFNVQFYDIDYSQIETSQCYSNICTALEDCIKMGIITAEKIELIMDFSQWTFYRISRKFIPKESCLCITHLLDVAMKNNVLTKKHDAFVLNIIGHLATMHRHDEISHLIRRALDKNFFEDKSAIIVRVAEKISSIPSDSTESDRQSSPIRTAISLLTDTAKANMLLPDQGKPILEIIHQWIKNETILQNHSEKMFNQMLSQMFGERIINNEEKALICHLILPLQSFLSTNPPIEGYLFAMNVVTQIFGNIYIDDFCREDFELIHELLEILLDEFQKYEDSTIKIMSFIAQINFLVTSLDPAAISESDKMDIKSFQQKLCNIDYFQRKTAKDYSNIIKTLEHYIKMGIITSEKVELIMDCSRWVLQELLFEKNPHSLYLSITALLCTAINKEMLATKHSSWKEILYFTDQLMDRKRHHEVNDLLTAAISKNILSSEQSSFLIQIADVISTFPHENRLEFAYQLSPIKSALNILTIATEANIIISNHSETILDMSHQWLQEKTIFQSGAEKEFSQMLFKMLKNKIITPENREKFLNLLPQIMKIPAYAYYQADLITIAFKSNVISLLDFAFNRIACQDDLAFHDVYQSFNSSIKQGIINHDNRNIILDFMQWMTQQEYYNIDLLGIQNNPIIQIFKKAIEQEVITHQDKPKIQQIVHSYYEKYQKYSAFIYQLLRTSITNAIFTVEDRGYLKEIVEEMRKKRPSLAKSLHQEMQSF